MSRTVNHISLHRIASTELRVIADVEEGVLPFIQVEEAVIQTYVRCTPWPHRWVTLFVLGDLQPLVRQLAHGTSPASLEAAGYDLSQESVSALSERPLVNVYDLADLNGCTIFANRQAMEALGYWEDPLALRGLLAHEHAHPLAENGVARLSRRLRLQVDDDGTSNSEIRNLWPRISPLLTSLFEMLCLLAPREIFTNTLAIRNGFAESLLHLNLQNAKNAAQSVAGREELARQLQQEQAQGDLTQKEADLLMLVGDLNGQLPLSIEAAAFYLAGRAAEARQFETPLETALFPNLDPLAVRAFGALKERYLSLQPELAPADLVGWGERTLDTLASILAEKGLALHYRLWIDEERKT